MSETNSGISGGEGGIPMMDYFVPVGARIREVEVTSGWFVDSIKVVYVDAAGNMQALPGLGGNGADVHHFVLEDDEYLVGISGRSNQYVDSICFHTNKRVSPTYGGDGGEVAYSFLAAEGSEVVGFLGRADWYIDAIGVITRLLPVSASAPEKAASPKPVAKAKKVAETPKAAETKAAKAPKSTAEKATKTAAPSKKARDADTVKVAEPVSVPDNLQIVEGIGPKIAELLAQQGITTFAALAKTPPTQLREMLLAAGRRFAVTDPTTWPEQAAVAASGDMDALRAMQAELKGGRKTA